jgi:AcrR family transcriptional regulator
MAIDAAGQIVAEAGLRGLTTRKVATALGYSPGSLYMVFDGLDDLIMQTNVVTVTALRDALVKKSCDITEPAAVLRALSHAYLNYALTNANRWRAVFDHQLPDGQERPQWYDNAIGPVMSLVRAPVHRLNEYATEEHVLLKTTAVWSAVHGVTELSVGRKLDASGVTDPFAVLDTILDNLT